MSHDYLIGKEQRIFRFNGMSESECRAKDLFQNDIFRVEGTKGWWKAMNTPYLNEQSQSYNIDVEPREFLVG